MRWGKVSCYQFQRPGVLFSSCLLFFSFLSRRGDQGKQDANNTPGPLYSLSHSLFLSLSLSRSYNIGPLLAFEPTWSRRPWLGLNKATESITPIVWLQSVSTIKMVFLFLSFQGSSVEQRMRSIKDGQRAESSPDDSQRWTCTKRI
jgi:hypothetical protein